MAADLELLSARELRRLKRAVPALHAWYREQARELPWRQTRDPYAIWVSEVMLQQTQVQTVIPYYRAFLAAFPDPAALAAASEEEVLRVWEGLGYYRRALNLRAAARALVAERAGELPRTLAELRALPGVGAYTAAAIASIAFGLDAATVDGNVRRVLCRLVALAEDPRRPPFAAALDELAAALLPAGEAEIHNQAMMELGARVCTPRAPACAACPLAAPCLGRASGDPARLPARPRRRELPHHEVAIGIVRRRGRYLVDQRPYDGLLGGLWEFPGGKLEPGESVEQALARELDEELGLAVEIEAALEPVEHAYSHFSVTLHPRLCRYLRMDGRAGEGRPLRWLTLAALREVPMPRANRKLLVALAQAPRPRAARRPR